MKTNLEQLAEEHAQKVKTVLGKLLGSLTDDEQILQGLEKCYDLIEKKVELTVSKVFTEEEAKEVLEFQNKYGHKENLIEARMTVLMEESAGEFERLLGV